MFQTEVVEEIKAHILCSIHFFFFFLNLAFHKTIWKFIVGPGRPQMTVWLMRVACWVPKATWHTLRIYNTWIASPRQQCLHVRASVLRHTYMYCLSLYLVWWGICEKVAEVSLSCRSVRNCIGPIGTKRNHRVKFSAHIHKTPNLIEIS